MRRRLEIAIAAVAALAVLLFAVPLGVVLQRVYRNEELLRLQRDTVAATRGIDVDPTPGDPVELPDPAELAVYDLLGRRIAGRGGPPVADVIVRDVLREAAPAAHARDGRLVAAVPLLAEERVTGAVRAERSDEQATAEARERWLVLLAVAGGVVGLAIVAAGVVSRRLAAPLERLAESARRLGEGDFAIRAPRTGVHEVDDVAAALDSAAARLDELVSRERAFSADASHQLRTPLAALRIELEALELRGAGSQEVTAALAQVDRIEGTVATLLAAARDAPRRATATAMAEVLRAAEQRWGGALQDAGRELRVRLDEEAMLTPVPAAVLREILDVLLDNAVRHGAGTVELRCRRAAGSLALDVSDEGRGPAPGAEDVFARRTGTPGGHGIGLALARSLSHAEGGRLVLSRPSPPVFTLFVPAAIGSEAPPPDA